MVTNPSDFDIPEALPAPKRGWSPQLVWLIPILAVLVGGWLAVKAVLERGPTATISFKTAEGLEAGKTKIKYKNVDIGEVTGITLSEDRSQIVVTAQFSKEAKSFLVEGTAFWVVRPQIGAGGVSGLGTLFSGAYIGVDPGSSTERRREFTGLANPPVVTMDQPGRHFILRSADLGSLSPGSPVYFRRTTVGQVVATDLEPSGKGVTIKVFVAAPYDQYVTAETRFWDASGIDVTLDASGIRVDTQSLGSILLGGIAFQTRPDAPVSPPAEANTMFTLYDTRDKAMRLPDTKTVLYTLIFDESLRGLEVGAPVDFRGVVVGEVAEIGIDLDPIDKRIRMRADVNVHANRLEMRARNAAQVAVLPADRKTRLDLLIARGLRGQIKTGSLLTGQLYVSLDFFPEARPATMNWTTDPPEFPTVQGGLQELQMMLHRVASKFEKVPIDKIGADLQQMLQSASSLAKRLDTEVAPEARATLAEARKTLKSDAPLQQDARETLREVGKAAQAMRVLADYLERHPEALVRGKKGDKS